jgi:hypothetical protein
MPLHHDFFRLITASWPGLRDSVSQGKWREEVQVMSRSYLADRTRQHDLEAPWRNLETATRERSLDMLGRAGLLGTRRDGVQTSPCC